MILHQTSDSKVTGEEYIQYCSFHHLSWKNSQRKSQDCMWLQQCAISHVIQTDCNRYPVDNESVLTLLLHQKTMNWKDMALWFCQRQCLYLLPYYESNQKEIGSDEIRSEHLCHSW